MLLGFECLLMILGRLRINSVSGSIESLGGSRASCGGMQQEAIEVEHLKKFLLERELREGNRGVNS